MYSEPWSHVQEKFPARWVDSAQPNWELGWNEAGGVSGRAKEAIVRRDSRRITKGQYMGSMGC